MLTIENLHATVNNAEILRGVNLQINPGEVHAIMGPNGSGKTTLSHVLAGRDEYVVTEGSVLFENKNLLILAPEERAVAGVFLAMQYPVEIPGVNNTYFLKTALNAIRKARGESSLDAFEFMELLKSHLKQVGMDEKFLSRFVNSGFSGGEKKRNEILQMLLLQPKLAILDETDSGLDVDALQIVARGINQIRNSKRAILVITHYQRLLNYVEPDFVHILSNGRIVKSGGKQLALEIEESGYATL
ncbi:MAG: FeS assembly ATPase SufC [uncultured bacterium]|nr:MAG: FeS assembly ATPase SufC [uncultured bacterium]OGT25861.1 MAG: Fe-S cluster assembly ATPase SufC [Gammaproteobacteria bacterium RIFCSPHIGHO2_02_FULL_42_43]OGT28827.1 MAG: Fe-S cluster assembly ATPase SufC [Gammaproteobacteria bacterium RIFCSPHIGHO2_01_FULL_42_8]OGT52246.1 MAG: Fe-S cluster assembly ATPase SufC [Gammaproteobacteria bacterium RIFCSPHIGHO2_12_FULL_41_25]OGT61859.1 MAG: Fe-S cluster assembly ATPase SufC [Gammaproteobacteria bacterium RIFCSPLOWO2_02_FULL_42_14]OGT86430.1 MA